ncbi:MAG: DUF3137 domain-containing protein [Hellea sp.]|nr:DUF3137 domain-containing protein [Hellea sp.]
MIQFDEKHPEFKGFTAYYLNELFPALQVKELDRLAAYKKLRKWGPLAVMGVVVTGILLFLRFRHFMIPIISLIAAGFFYWGLREHFLKEVRSQTKNHLVSGICKFIGWQFSEKLEAPPDLTPLVENGLLPKRYDRLKFEDKMWGNAHGADFEAFECHMEREDKDSDGDSNWVTVFQGSIMALDFHRKFLGRTVVLRDKGFFNRKKKAGMSRVGLVDPKFEKIFEAYGTDQVEARYLLTPTFMQRLVDLENSVDGKNIRFAFLDDLLLIAVETPNRFEAGSMRIPITDPKRTQDILDEVGAVYNVVDGLVKPQSRSSST